MTPRLALAAPQDLPALLEVCAEASRTPGSAWQAGEYPNGEILREDMELGGLYRLEADGKIIGLIGMGKLGELDELDWHGDGEKPCEIARFGLLPECAGKGLGGQVLTLALALAKDMGYDCARLLAGRDNARVQRLYARAGFMPLGEVRMWDEDFIQYGRKL